MSGMLRSIFNWILRRDVDVDELTFKEYLRLLESNDDEESQQLSEELREISRKMALSERAAGRNLSLAEIEVMKWKEIKFRISLMREDVLMQREAFENMLETIERAREVDRADRIGKGWDGAIISV